MNKQLLNKLLDKISNQPYKYYWYDNEDIVKEAFEREQRRLLNCWDGYFDKSAEASNRRIMEDIKRLRKKRGW